MTKPCSGFLPWVSFADTFRVRTEQIAQPGRVVDTNNFDFTRFTHPHACRPNSMKYVINWLPAIGVKNRTKSMTMRDAALSSSNHVLGMKAVIRSWQNSFRPSYTRFAWLQLGTWPYCRFALSDLCKENSNLCTLVSLLIFSVIFQCTSANVYGDWGLGTRAVSVSQGKSPTLVGFPTFWKSQGSFLRSVQIWGENFRGGEGGWDFEDL